MLANSPFGSCLKVEWEVDRTEALLEELIKMDFSKSDAVRAAGGCSFVVDGWDGERERLLEVFREMNLPEDVVALIEGEGGGLEQQMVRLLSFSFLFFGRTSPQL